MAKWNAGTARAMLAADGIGTRGALEEKNLEKKNWKKRTWSRRPEGDLEEENCQRRKKGLRSEAPGIHHLKFWNVCQLSLFSTVSSMLSGRLAKRFKPVRLSISFTLTA